MGVTLCLPRRVLTSITQEALALLASVMVIACGVSIQLLDIRTVLRPGKRPRITLTPTLVLKDGAPILAISVAGGDLQDQATMNLLLDFVEFGMLPRKMLLQHHVLPLPITKIRLTLIPIVNRHLRVLVR